MINKSNQVILFYLHFHKSGGTTINCLFEQYNKHNPNRNGNPWLDNEIIKFWDYNKKEFNKFKSNLIFKKINFVAFEWNYFKFYDEIDLSNIELIVCIRDPYSRYISNMKVNNCFDMNSFNQKTIWWSRVGSKQKFKLNYNKYNYYVKMLNGFGDNPDVEINEKHLEIAKKNLSKFSTIIILENKDTFKLLEKYNIHNIIHKNKNKDKDKTKIISNFEEFKKYNSYDYELYNYAIKLSNLKLKSKNSTK